MIEIRKARQGIGGHERERDKAADWSDKEGEARDETDSREGKRIEKVRTNSIKDLGSRAGSADASNGGRGQPIKGKGPGDGK